MRRAPIALVVLAGCVPGSPPLAPLPPTAPPAFRRLIDAPEVRVVAEQGKRTCALERSDAEDAGSRDAVFRTVPLDELVDRSLALESVRAERTEAGEIARLVFRAKMPDGAQTWLRTAIAPPGELARSVRCLLDPATVEKAVGALPKAAHLDLAVRGCVEVPAILGSRDDATFQTYTVGAPRIVLGEAPTPAAALEGSLGLMTVMVPLRAGEHRLEVSPDVARRCFAEGEQDEATATISDRATAWARSPSAAPPVISKAALTSVLGGSLDRCARETLGVESFTCGAMLPAFADLPGGGFTIERRRVAEAFTVYDGAVALDPSALAEAVSLRVARGVLPSLRRALESAIDAEVETPTRVEGRGVRVLRPSDLEGVYARATALELEATVTVGAPATAVENRTKTEVSGKRVVVNPAYKRAVRDAAIAADAVARARKAGVSADELALTSQRAEALAREASSTKKELEVDDRRDVLGSVKVLRRHGEVKVRLRVADTKAPNAFSRSLTVPFDLVREDPDKNPPEADAMDRAAARAVLDAIAPLLAGVAAETRLAMLGRAGALVPGSPGWLLRAASRAAGERPVRPLDVRLETRVESLANGPLTLPIKLADKARCLTFAVVSVDGETKIDLSIEPAAEPGRKHGVRAVRDARHAISAGVEACGLDPTRTWMLAIGTSHGAVPRGGLLLGVFGSDAGDATPADAAALLDRPVVSSATASTPLDASGR